VPGRPAATTVQEPETARLARERDEALEREKAAAEVLRVISSSPGEVKPVFQAILNNAVRICDAKFGVLSIYEGDLLRGVAMYNLPPAYARSVAARTGPGFRPHAKSTLGRLISTKRVVHTFDYPVEVPGYKAGDPSCVDVVELGGVRTLIAVPMLKENTLVGAITIFRQEVRPFTERQIELVKNFAAQAVIAIENTRLLNELRESLEQQTATSEVLRVISSSPGDLEPVFNAMLENAVHICDASFGNLLLYDGNFFRHVALHNAPPAWSAERERDPVPPRDTARVLYGVAETKHVAHIADMAVENAEEPISAIAGARTVLIVPMLKERELIGAIAIYRVEVRPFTDKQIALVQNFANQAVIAIENTRLLDDLNKLNRQLEQRVTDQVGEIERMGGCAVSCHPRWLI
jgi:GAF domain-containing protein